ncbi:MAG: hypothetical protein J0H01_35870 [Rhizobiales bacterium]|nr:hypothetical protein [Hyphomicrobiales bacterium]
MASELLPGELQSLIDLALSSETPRLPWTEGPADKVPPTASELNQTRRKGIRWLNRNGKRFDRPEAVNLAARVAQCKTGQRCLSGACPSCSGGMQRIMVEASRNRREELQADNRACVAVTIVAKGVRYGVNLIPDERMAKTGQLKERLERVLNKGDGHRAYGGVDLSLNKDARIPGELKFDGPTFSTHWRPHLQVIMTEGSFDQVEYALKTEFPRQKLISRPVVRKVLDASPSADAYLLKRLFEPQRHGRRETYRKHRAETRSVMDTTRAVALCVEERLDQLIYLDQLGLNGRLVFVRCRLVLTENGPSIEVI